MSFISEIVNSIRKIKVWELAFLILLFTRLITFDYSYNVVPGYENVGYRYYDVWFFIHSRIIEALMMFSVYYRTKILLFLLLSLWGLGKIPDELINPFHYYYGEAIWQLLSIFITYKVFKWTQKQKQKQPDWGLK